MQNQKDKKINLKRGLVLMELIVSLGVFIAVMTIGMGAVLQMFGINQKSQSLKAIMSNLNFALDSMAREIVVAKINDPSQYGSSFRCDNSAPLEVPKDCGMPNGGEYLTFCSSEGNRIAYSFNDSSNLIERKVSDDDDCPDVFSGEAWQRITAPEVKIEKLKFYVIGAEDPDDGKQPKVILVVEGEAGIKDDVKSKFNVQTTLSQRTPDLSVVLP